MKKLSTFLIAILSYYLLLYPVFANDAQTYFKKGINLAIQGDLNGAIVNYKQAITLDPLFGKAYNNLGYMYQQKGDNEQAIEYYKKAVDLNPRDDTAHSNLGSMYIATGMLEEGIQEFYKTLELDPGSFKVETDLENALKKKSMGSGKSFNEVKKEADQLYGNRLKSTKSYSLLDITYQSNASSDSSSTRLDLDTILKDVCQ